MDDGGPEPGLVFLRFRPEAEHLRRSEDQDLVLMTGLVLVLVRCLDQRVGSDRVVVRDLDQVLITGLVLVLVLVFLDLVLLVGTRDPFRTVSRRSSSVVWFCP